MRNAEKLSVPLAWFVSSVVFAVTVSIPCTYWVYGVNSGMREMRADVKLIKKKLNIADVTEEAATPSLIKEAEAKGK